MADWESVLDCSLFCKKIFFCMKYFLNYYTSTNYSFFFEQKVFIKNHQPTSVWDFPSKKQGAENDEKQPKPWKCTWRPLICFVICSQNYNFYMEYFHSKKCKNTFSFPSCFSLANLIVLKVSEMHTSIHSWNYMKTSPPRKLKKLFFKVS